MRVFVFFLCMSLSGSAVATKIGGPHREFVVGTLKRMRQLGLGHEARKVWKALVDGRNHDVFEPIAGASHEPRTICLDTCLSTVSMDRHGALALEIRGDVPLLADAIGPLDGSWAVIHRSSGASSKFATEFYRGKGTRRSLPEGAWELLAELWSIATESSDMMRAARQKVQAGTMLRGVTMEGTESIVEDARERTIQQIGAIAEFMAQTLTPPTAFQGLGAAADKALGPLHSSVGAPSAGAAVVQN